MTAPSVPRSPWLLVIAALGFIVPNGYFIYWLFFEWPGLAAVIANHLAVAFMLDAFITMGLLAWWFGDSLQQLILRFEAGVEHYLRPLLILVALSTVASYLVYHFLRHPVSTGDPDT